MEFGNIRQCLSAQPLGMFANTQRLYHTNTHTHSKLLCTHFTQAFVDHSRHYKPESQAKRILISSSLNRHCSNELRPATSTDVKFSKHKTWFHRGTYFFFADFFLRLFNRHFRAKKAVEIEIYWKKVFSGKNRWNFSKMSNQDSDGSKPVGRFARLMSAAQKSSDDSGITKPKDEPKTIGGRGRLLQMAVSTTKKSRIAPKKLRLTQLLLRIWLCEWSTDNAFLFFFALFVNQQSDEVSPITSSSGLGGGRGNLLQMLQKSSVGNGSEQTAQSTAEQTSQEKTSQDKSSDDARKVAPALGGSGQPGRGE